MPVSWEDVIGEYVNYISTPRWRGKALTATGSRAADHVSHEQARAIRARLVKLTQGAGQVRTVGVRAIEQVLQHRKHVGRRFDSCPKAIWHLWRALVFSRDRYRCRYCGRDTWTMLNTEKRGLRLELDHLKPRASMKASDDFHATNIVTACRSCNVMKGQMDVERFGEELRSLAAAVVRLGPS